MLLERQPTNVLNYEEFGRRDLDVLDHLQQAAAAVTAAQTFAVTAVWLARRATDVHINLAALRSPHLGGHISEDLQRSWFVPLKHEPGSLRLIRAELVDELLTRQCCPSKSNPVSAKTRAVAPEHDLAGSCSWQCASRTALRRHLKVHRGRWPA